MSEHNPYSSPVDNTSNTRRSSSEGSTTGLIVAFALLGAMVGMGLGYMSFQSQTAELLSADPDATICGNGLLAAVMGLGFVGGATGGLVGLIIGRMRR